MKILLFANTDWYLYNFRLSLATALRSAGHEVVLASPSGSYVEKLNRLGCVFHAKVDTDSTPRWTVIPRQAGHVFHGKLDT